MPTEKGEAAARLTCGSLAVLLVAAPCINATTALAQEVERGTSALDLPRLGYEARGWRSGGHTIHPQLLVEGNYNSNVYATSTNADDDYIVTVAPRIDVTSALGNLNLASDVFVTHREYLDNGRESNTTFGGGTKGGYTISRTNSVNFGARFQRAVESRADPEANASVLLSPRKINVLTGDLGYSYQGNRLGVSLQGGVQNVNFLNAGEQDKDNTIYRVSLRGSLMLKQGMEVFIQPYYNRRDARLRVDRNGVDRDTTTIGALAGIKLDLGNVWRGDMGVGVFRANPDQAGFPSRTGFAVNGRLIWSPDERTAFTLAAFRGDVATIRAGATSRTDTNLSLRWDQEIRHNLLLNAIVGVNRTEYKGSPRQKRTTGFGRVEVEYLLNQRLSAFANAGYTTRSAPIDTNEFKRTIVGLGLRLRF